MSEDIVPELEEKQRWRKDFRLADGTERLIDEIRLRN